MHPKTDKDFIKFKKVRSKLDNGNVNTTIEVRPVGV